MLSGHCIQWRINNITVWGEMMLRSSLGGDRRAATMAATGDTEYIYQHPWRCSHISDQALEACVSR
jgi:hypothetical protein